jgi:hypothetical protein
VCVRLRRSPRSVDNAVVTGIGWALFGVGAGTLLAIALTSDVGPQNQGVLAEYPEHYNPPPAPVPRRRSPFASNAILRFPARSTLQGYEWPTALGGSSTSTGRLLEPGKWILGTHEIAPLRLRVAFLCLGNRPFNRWTNPVVVAAQAVKQSQELNSRMLRTTVASLVCSLRDSLRCLLVRAEKYEAGPVRTKLIEQFCELMTLPPYARLSLLGPVSRCFASSYGHSYAHESNHDLRREGHCPGHDAGCRNDAGLGECE